MKGRRLYPGREGTSLIRRRMWQYVKPGDCLEKDFVSVLHSCVHG
jgi:hypothetical protein